LWLELARCLHAVRPAPSEGLASLLARIWRDEGRLLRLRSGRAVRRGTRLVESLSGGLDRALRSARHEAGDGESAAKTSREPGSPP
jgi:hypothetical protein